MSADALARILEINDRGGTVAEMIEASGLGQTRVYALLKEHRPKRARQPRKRTSDLPWHVRHLAAASIKPPRIAFLLEITPAYVYRILSE